jgi:hypothetical protein
MSHFSSIKKEFFKLSAKEQEAVLRDLYQFSNDNKRLLEGKLLDGDIPAKEFIRQMEKETIAKVYKRGTPQTPNGKVVNSIISKAQKSNVGLHTMMILEEFAYRGFIEYLNEFGGGPESFDEQACNHLETYLKLTKENIVSPDREEIFQEVKNYLQKKDNMFTDTLYDTYHEVTGDNI